MKSLHLLLLILGVFATQVFSQEIDTQRLIEYLEYIEEENQSIGNLSILKDGVEVYNRSFGQSNVANLHFDDDTKYQIGSISKLYTAVLVWKLIEEQKLKETDHLSDFFPNVPNARNITIKHLLEHSSGLADFAIDYEWLLEPVTENEILKRIREQEVLFNPGDSVSYSNSGYYLLTKIVEKKYNDAFANILNKEIIQPIQLAHTNSLQLEKQPNVFQSYTYKNDTWEVIKEFHFQNIPGVGDMVATPKDLNKFLHHLFNNEVLTNETIERMKPIIGIEGFGRGLMFIPFDQYFAFGHGGNTLGTNTLASYNPENKLAIAFSINGERYLHTSMTLDLYAIIYGKDIDLPNFNLPKLDVEILKLYEGLYASNDFPIEIKVFQEDGMLKAQASGQSAFPLEFIGEHKFQFTPGKIEIKFDAEKDTLYLIQYGNQLEMKRNN